MSNLSRAEKEAFVSGLTGTSYWEIYLVIATSTLGLFLRHIGILCFPTLAKWHKNNILFALFWEFITVILPGLLIFTILADYIWAVLIVEVVLTVTALVAMVTHYRQTTNLLNVCHNLSSCLFPARIPCVSLSRTWTLVFTTIAILGVDFTIFPRRFAKTETYGTGLMDVGVGCFMISHGAVAKEARFPVASSAAPSCEGYFRSVASCVRALVPLLVIGALRTLSVQATDYQLHTSEYGVHWNFFFTIAAVKLLAALVSPLLTYVSIPLRYATAFLAMGVVYQVCLSRGGLKEYIMFGSAGDYSRIGFVDANREGIFSCIGYLALYFGGIEMGRVLFQCNRNLVRLMRRVVVMLFVFIACGGVAVWLDRNVEQASRRMANLTFCFWMLSVAGIIVVIMFVADMVVLFLAQLTKPLHSPSPFYSNCVGKVPLPHVCLMFSLDYNQFAIFLLANLSTGMINFSVDTIHTSELVSFFILTCHMLLLSAASIILWKKKVKLL